MILKTDLPTYATKLKRMIMNYRDFKQKPALAADLA